MNYQNYIRIIVFLFFIQLVTSCFNRDPIGRIIMMPESAIAMNPYTGKEKIYLANQVGDTMIFSGGQRTIIREERYHSSQMGGNDEKVLIEAEDRTSFQSDYLYTKLRIMIFSKNDFSYANEGLNIVLAIRDSNRHAVFPILPLVETIEFAKTEGYFEEQIILGNVGYKDVFVLPGYEEMIFHKKYLKLTGDTLYYTFSDGIVGLKLREIDQFVKVRN